MPLPRSHCHLGTTGVALVRTGPTTRGGVCQCRRRPYRSLGRTMSGMFKSAGLNDPLYLNGVDEDAAWTFEGPISRSGPFSVSWS